MKQILRVAALMVGVFLSGCGSSSRPNLAAHLAYPTTPLLMVIPAPELINEKAAQIYAHDVAGALNDYGILTTDNRANNQNWQLQISTNPQNGLIIPHYKVIGPDRKSYGQIAGAPILSNDWQAGQQEKLSEAAAKDSASLSKLLARINSTVQKNNPHSLANRTPVLFIGPTIGAPGEGDETLPAKLSEALKATPLKLTPSPEDADFSVTCLVEIVSTSPSEKLAEINWIIKDSGNRLVGQVTQLHELKTQTFLNFWDAPPASEIQEAAEGILTVIHNDILKTAQKSEI